VSDECPYDNQVCEAEGDAPDDGARCVCTDGFEGDTCATCGANRAGPDCVPCVADCGEALGYGTCAVLANSSSPTGGWAAGVGCTCALGHRNAVRDDPTEPCVPCAAGESTRRCFSCAACAEGTECVDSLTPEETDVQCDCPPGQRHPAIPDGETLCYDLATAAAFEAQYQDSLVDDDADALSGSGAGSGADVGDILGLDPAVFSAIVAAGVLVLAAVAFVSMRSRAPKPKPTRGRRLRPSHRTFRRVRSRSSSDSDDNRH
jgi:hypothetical protein